MSPHACIVHVVGPTRPWPHSCVHSALAISARGRCSSVRPVATRLTSSRLPAATKHPLRLASNCFRMLIGVVAEHLCLLFPDDPGFAYRHHHYRAKTGAAACLEKLPPAPAELVRLSPSHRAHRDAVGVAAPLPKLFSRDLR